MRHALTCGRVLALAQIQDLQNSASQMVMLRFTTLSREIATEEIQEREKYRECSNVKSARVSALKGLSATQNGRAEAKSFSTH